MNKRSLLVWLLVVGVAFAGTQNPNTSGVATTTGNNTYSSGTTQSFDVITVGSETVSNLVVTTSATIPSFTSSSASVATNTASIGRVFNTLALNTIKTNGNYRAYVSASLVLSATVTQPGKVALLTLDAGSTNSIGFVSADAGVIFNTTDQLGGWISPNQVFVFTNLSGAGASAAMATNLVWQF